MDTFFKVKDKLLHLAPPRTENGAQCLVGLFGFWRQHIPYLGALLWLIHPGSEQEKFLQLIQASVQAALSLGPYDPVDPMVLEVSVADRYAVWSFWQAPPIQYRPLGFWNKVLPSSDILGRNMWLDLSEWAKNVKIFVFHINAHQRVTLAEEIVNNQADKMTNSVNISFLHQVPLSPNGLMNKMAIVARMEVQRPILIPCYGTIPQGDQAATWWQFDYWTYRIPNSLSWYSTQHLPDQRTHKKFSNGLTHTHGIICSYHVPYHPKASGFMEQWNGLLKAQLHGQLGGTSCRAEAKLAVCALNYTPSDLQSKYLLPVPATLFSAGLEALVPKAGILPLRDTTMIPLNWKLSLSPSHFGLPIPLNQ
ncbi:unnamed protein product [Nyctereutes procyonoides]|uniref:(raccoon dog) hypothetical protein n=1 Tax=Nyctereutes procyonoides TaxID=34880 RepID=A0A811Z005_NYCPR|nr:unnamed protein product [Nyctereutes procyonoides]